MDNFQGVFEGRQTPFVQLRLLLEKFPMQEEVWTTAAETVPWGFYTRNAGPGHVSGRCVFRERKTISV